MVFLFTGSGINQDGSYIILSNIDTLELATGNKRDSGKEEERLNYGEIKKCDIANGEGVRVALFVSGCRHHCKGCFNSMTWDFNYGKEFTSETEDEILEALKPDYIDGLSLLGGEPFEPENQAVLVPFLRRVKECYPQKNIWCYTGYLYDEELKKESRARCEYTDEMLSMLDVLVDGRFEEDKKNITLLFRGSENQRLIDVQKSLQSGEIVEWQQKVKRGI